MPQACGCGNVRLARRITADSEVEGDGGEAGRGIGNAAWLAAFASGCLGIPAPTYTDRPKQSYKIFCASILRSQADSDKSEFVFLNRSPTAHEKGRIPFHLSFPLTFSCPFGD